MERDGARDVVRHGERYPPPRGEAQPATRELMLQQKCISARIEHGECECCRKIHPVSFVFGNRRWSCSCKYCNGR